MSVETIELVVHPLFDYISELRKQGFFKHVFYGGNASEYVFKHNKAERKVIKHRLSNFGRLVKKVAGNDKAVLCFVPTGEYDMKTEAFYDYKRLEDYAKRVLGERFIVLEPDMGFSKQYWPLSRKRAMLRRASQQLSGVDFSGNVSLNVTGEFAEECARNAEKRIGFVLGRRKIGVSVSRSKDLLSGKDREMLKEAAEGWLTKFRKWRQKTYGKRSALRNK